MRDVRYILKEARELWAFRESERLTHMLVKMDGSVIPFYLVKARSIYHSHHKGPKSEKVSIIRVTHHKGKPIASPHSDFPAPDMHSSFRWSMIIMVRTFFLQKTLTFMESVPSSLSSLCLQSKRNQNHHIVSEFTINIVTFAQHLSTKLTSHFWGFSV